MPPKKSKPENGESLVEWRLREIEKTLDKMEATLFTLQIRAAGWGFIAGSIPTLIALVSLWQSWRGTTGK